MRKRRRGKDDWILVSIVSKYIFSRCLFAAPLHFVQLLENKKKKVKDLRSRQWTVSGREKRNQRPYIIYLSVSCLCCVVCLQWIECLWVLCLFSLSLCFFGD